MKLIVGLGNPGKEYDGTRHNIGREIVRALGNDWRMQKKLHAEIAVYATRGALVDTRAPLVRLAIPTTFMNDSGRAVQQLLSTFDFRLSDLLVVHDDLDLPLGTLRFSHGSGAAGQKGVQSIIDTLGTKDFARLRIGVAGAHRTTTDAADYVLKKFSKEEQLLVRTIKKQAEQALMDFINKPLTSVMSTYNKKA
ncbi:aminoacyl-tRNA hydrolase [Candidatus Uhrbacteria bacterium]|nr:aminoacyl-tRNA hydrolase [Candidatus Uhrbacteria bacterium]